MSTWRMKPGARGRGGLGALALALALAAPAGAPAAEDALGAMLGGLARQKAPEGRVDVQGWLEQGGEGTDLVVTLVPHGAAKLVADPGITITPLPGGAGGAAPVTLVDPSRDYLAEPPVLRLPLPGHDPARPVEAQVDYAYCLADYQCLFGEATVRVAGAPASCAPGTTVC